MTDLVALLNLAGVTAADHRRPPAPGPWHPDGVLLHHTASPKNAGNMPALSICRYGRSDLPGPLCQLLIGRDGSVAVITDGRANHAGNGYGQALTRMKMSQPVIPPGPDSTGGNAWFYGVEVENDGLGEPYSDDCINSIVEVTLALCNHFGWDPLYKVLGHKEWTTRKIDPTYDMNWMRGLLVTGIEEDDMYTDEDRKRDQAAYQVILDTNKKVNKLHDALIEQVDDLKRKLDKRTRVAYDIILADGDPAQFSEETKKVLADIAAKES